jgi:AraC family transcriptional regulator
MSENSASRILFSGPTVAIGEFRCPPGHRLWCDENIARGVLLVFPRVPVGIEQAGREKVLADSNTVMFYNAGQTYRRRLVCPRGDECEFFVIDGAAAADAVRRSDPRGADSPAAPFPFVHGPGDSRAYILQRRLCDRVRAGTAAEPLEIEETAMDLLGAAVAAACRVRRRPMRHRQATSRAHADLAEAAKALLSRRLAEPLALGDIARAVHSSPYHLCRIFRRHTGDTMHHYRDRLRLRAALEALADGRCTLARLALDLGYCNQSHFSDAFGREFGITPSAFRARAPHSGSDEQDSRRSA